MKNISILLTIFTVATLYSQSYEIDFAGTGDTTVVDSVWIKNLNQDTSITLMGNDILQFNVIPDVNAIGYDTSENIASYKNQPRAGLLKSDSSTTEMPYKEGDRLLFTGMSGTYSTIVTDVPTGSMTITFDFINCMDADSNYYPVVIIGTQTWMAENLKTTRYNDNTAIPMVTDNTTWANTTTPAYCWYNNNEPAYKNLYGALYNWHTVDTGNFCPVGWHVPGDDEWKTLEMYLGMNQSDADAAGSRGTNEGDKLKESGTEHWVSPNTGATNESGFSALPGGYRNFNLGSYNDLRIFTGFWSSTEYSSNSAWYRTLHFYHSDIERYYGSKEYGASVRCVRD